jgi:hypothetical protein
MVMRPPYPARVDVRCAGCVGRRVFVDRPGVALAAPSLSPRTRQRAEQLGDHARAIA